MINEHDLHDVDPAEALTSCEEGTVGHPGDPDVVDLGESGDVALVKVTLRKGHPQGKPTADDGGFNGYQITARVAATIWNVPLRGARVILAIPGGDIQTPGSPVIIAEVGARPVRRFGRKKTVLDYSGKDVVIVAKSITLIDDSNQHFVSVSSNGARVVSAGSGFFVKGTDLAAKVLDEDGNLLTYLAASASDIALVRAAEPANPVTFALTSQGVEMMGKFVTIDFIDAIKFGAAASPATPVVVGPSGQTGIGSTRMWGTP
ncbi:hypothetical protein [Sorangium sp. So ce233]|uniref:hypothetical protein n=1 Tax=Sorangium sp. So ce233 TaxID=3133290 RepID=UPI003F5FB92D